MNEREASDVLQRVWEVPVANKLLWSFFISSVVVRPEIPLPYYITLSHRALGEAFLQLIPELLRSRSTLVVESPADLTEEILQTHNFVGVRSADIDLTNILSSTPDRRASVLAIMPVALKPERLADELLLAYSLQPTVVQEFFPALYGRVSKELLALPNKHPLWRTTPKTMFVGVTA